MSVALLERELNSIGVLKESIITYEKLNIYNEEEVIEFEKELYKGYSKDKNGWIFKNYIKIGNRLKHIFSYKDLLIYVAKRNGKIIGGMSGQLNPFNIFQVEMMGFNIEKNNLTCEGLTIFVNDNFQKLDVINNLGKLIVDDIIKRGFKKTYTSTNESFVNFHVFIFEWEEIEKKLIDNEFRFLLKKEII